MNTASSLVNRSYLDDVWNIAVTKIASSVRTHSVRIRKAIFCQHCFIYILNLFTVVLYRSSPYVEDQEPGHAL